MKSSDEETEECTVCVGEINMNKKVTLLGTITPYMIVVLLNVLH